MVPYAVRCAIDIQQRLRERNSQAAHSSIQLRIGSHLGDVEVRGTDVFGDSVNVASRIEPLAEPGGICVTEAVFGQVQNKIPNRLERRAPQTLKNVSFPVEIYRIILPWNSTGFPVSDSGQSRAARARDDGGRLPRLVLAPSIGQPDYQEWG